MSNYEELDPQIEADRRRIRENQAERAREEAERRAERQRKAQEALEMLNAQAKKQETEKAAAEEAKKQAEQKAERPQLPTVHVVQPGDTLSAIALKYYGNAALWTEIYKANKKVIGNDPGKIFPGQELKIPALG